MERIVPCLGFADQAEEAGVHRLLGDESSICEFLIPWR